VKLLKYLAFPIAMLYGLITWVRNYLYDKRMLASTSFDFPLICVGNLSTGGTGKTPHIEYLIRLLHEKYPVATLSRGYGRKSRGFILAGKTLTADEIGDEPLQFKSKFPEAAVAVCNDRVLAVPRILEEHPETAVILLDDAYQHRRIRPGMNILLTEFSKPFYRDYMLPTGSLREFRSGYKRADVVIITKCPPKISPKRKFKVYKKIRPLPTQTVLFSSIKYGDPVPMFGSNQLKAGDLKNQHAFLITGIANSKPLVKNVKDTFKKYTHMRFNDHHDFTDEDIVEIIFQFNLLKPKNKIILTTEKDAMRLKKHQSHILLQDKPIYFLPIEIVFSEKDKGKFDNLILKYVGANKTGN
jgi:tetraacyldisaccharide 4'-kinase